MGKWKDYSDLTLTVIHAVEREPPVDVRKSCGN